MQKGKLIIRGDRRDGMMGNILNSPGDVIV